MHRIKLLHIIHKFVSDYTMSISTALINHTVATILILATMNDVPKFKWDAIQEMHPS